MPDGRARFERFLHDMIEGRHDAVAPLLADDVRWHLPPFAKQPPIEGKGAVLKFLAEAPSLYSAPGSMKLEPRIVTADGPFVSCLATLRATTKRGAPYENRYVFFARLEGERLREVWEMMDTVHFQEQLRAPGGEAANG